MGVYVDTPIWERWHGLSGHMVADSVHELQAFAEQLGLDRRCFMRHALVVHYQLPANRRPDAIAAGATPLEQTRFMQMVGQIQRLRQAGTDSDTPTKPRQDHPGRQRTPTPPSQHPIPGRASSTPLQAPAQASLF